MTRKMPGKLKISRTTNTLEEDYVTITVGDLASRTTFLSMKMSILEFGSCILGMSERPVELTVKGIDRIGKRKITESRKATFEGCLYNRETLEAMVSEHCQESGWIVDNYLGSQGSISHDDGKTVVRYSVLRYEEVV